MATAQQVFDHVGDQQNIARLVRRELDQWLAAHPEPTGRELAEAVNAIVNHYGPMSADTATAWYNMLRRLAGNVEGEYGPVPATVDLSAAIGKAVGRAIGEPQRLAALVPKVQKWVRQWGRDTIVNNAQADPGDVRFARMPIGKTCAFCLMLASRGAVYHTNTEAGDLNDYHPGCDCQIVPVFPGQQPPYDVAPLEAIYERGRTAAGSGDPKQIAAAIRRDPHSGVTDAVKPDQRSEDEQGWAGHTHGYVHPHGAPLWSEAERVRRQDALGIVPAGEQLYQHEIESVERMQALGHQLRWLARTDRHATNDAIWIDQGNIAIELKATRAKSSTMSARITDCFKQAEDAAERGDVVVSKVNFVFDIGPSALTDRLRNQLAHYNIRRAGQTPERQIKRLWVLSRGQLVEIPLL